MFQECGSIHGKKKLANPATTTPSLSSPVFESDGFPVKVNRDRGGRLKSQSLSLTGVQLHFGGSLLQVHS